MNNLAFCVKDSLVEPWLGVARFDSRSRLVDYFMQFGQRLDLLVINGEGPAALAPFMAANPEFQLASEKVGLAWKTSEVIELIWAFQACQKFLNTSAEFLLLMDSQIWIPETVNELIDIALAALPADADALWFYAKAAELSGNAAAIEEITEPVHPNTSLADTTFFTLTRSGAQKFLEICTSGLATNLSETVFGSSSILTSYAINRSLPNQPTVWTELNWSAEQLIAQELPYSPSAFHHASRTLSGEFYPEQRIQTFISHWFKSIPTIDSLLDGLHDSGLDPIVLNATEEHKEGWVDFPHISFFDQFRYACRNFDSENDYLFFITADVNSTYWPTVIDRARKILRKFRPGTLGPVLTSEGLPVESVGLHYSHDKDLAIVQRNDIICLFIHKDFIAFFNEFFDFFAQPEFVFEVKVGYGLLDIMTHKSYQPIRPQLRDLGVLVYHPKGKGYSHEFAMEERLRILAVYEQFYHLKGLSKSFFGAMQNNPSIFLLYEKGMPFDINA